MIVKKLLCPQRVRRVPGQFSWVDHRLVRDKYIQRCRPEALALYLLLVTVSDAKGLSYYSDATVNGLLGLNDTTLGRARRELMEAGLIAYEYPLYQVLSLDEPEVPQDRGVRRNEPMLIGDLLGQMIGGQP